MYYLYIFLYLYISLIDKDKAIKIYYEGLAHAVTEAVKPHICCLLMETLESLCVIQSQPEGLRPQSAEVPGQKMDVSTQGRGQISPSSAVCSIQALCC